MLIYQRFDPPGTALCKHSPYLRRHFIFMGHQFVKSYYVFSTLLDKTGCPILNLDRFLLIKGK